MEKAKFFSYIFIVLIISFLGLQLVNYFTRFGSLEINGKKFKVEIADDDWETREGLSGREKLREDGGMLFVFPKSDYYGFWMKDMKFPIDIIWIDGGKITDIKQKAPVPAANSLEKYITVVPARYVLEINSGLVEKYGFKIGDKVKLDI